MFVMVAQQFTVHLEMVKILYYVYFTTILKKLGKEVVHVSRVL